MEQTTLSPAEKMTIAIAKAKESRKRAKDEAKLALLDNDNYIGYLASLEDEAEQVTALTAVLDMVNKMKPIVATDGTKYSVNCYPIKEPLFGPVASRVLGLIVGSSAMFTDERQAEFQALTNINYLAFTKARESIGSPAYFSKGNYVPATIGNGECRESAILAILQGLDVDIDYAKNLNQSNIDKWFALSESKAKEASVDYKKTQLIDNSQSFTLED